MDKKLFSDLTHVQNYVNLRPKVPHVVADVILEFLRDGVKDEHNTSRPGLVLDVGCGSGQSSSVFAPHFTRVIGLDPSENQIKFAREINPCLNVQFQVGPAESLPVEDASVSLVAAMTAAHWFDLDSFYSECRRVLVPGGVIALGGNGYIPDFTKLKFPIWEDPMENAEKTRKLQNLVEVFDGRLDWSPRVKLFVDHYRDLPLPDRTVFYVTRSNEDDCVQEVKWTFDDVIGFFSTWSGYNSFVKKNPESNILTNLKRDLASVLGERKNVQFVFLVRYFIVLMNKL